MSDVEKVDPFITLVGHTENVEDLWFNPNNSNELCSSSQDKTVLFWDTRSGTKPTLKIENIHTDDINWIDWNKFNENLLLTGSSDFTVSVVDIRNCKPIKQFDQHKSSINYVKWSPFKEHMFASSGTSLMLWNLKTEGSELMFNHTSHVGPVIDFDWNYADEWSFISTSDDWESVVIHDEGSLQMYRPLDLIVDDFDVALKRLTQSMETSRNSEQ